VFLNVPSKLVTLLVSNGDKSIDAGSSLYFFMANANASSGVWFICRNKYRFAYVYSIKTFSYGEKNEGNFNYKTSIMPSKLKPEQLCDKRASGKSVELFWDALVKCPNYYPQNTNVQCVKIATKLVKIMGVEAFLESLYDCEFGTGIYEVKRHTPEYVNYLLKIGFKVGMCPGFEREWVCDIKIVKLLCEKAPHFIYPDIVDKCECYIYALNYGVHMGIKYFERALNLKHIKVLQSMSVSNPEWKGEVGQPDDETGNECPNGTTLGDLVIFREQLGLGFSHSLISSLIYDGNVIGLKYVGDNGGVFAPPHVLDAIVSNSLECAKYLVEIGVNYVDARPLGIWSAMYHDNEVTSYLAELKNSKAKRQKI
jgi:hypothetical protein